MGSPEGRCGVTGRVLVSDGGRQLVAPDKATVARYYGVSRRAVKAAIKNGTELAAGVTVDETDEMLPLSRCFSNMNAYRAGHKSLRAGKPPEKEDCRICENCVKYSVFLLPDGSFSGVCRTRCSDEKPAGGGWLKVGEYWREAVGRWQTCSFFTRRKG